ncbi:unnamed protein product [Brassica oleracea]|uniref:(rape) hypothetical protein n=1 Tax=Brassica napus TaxID=3708 RepID=A0A816UL07_BRANA|nr:unnamed protein product [Brassica napus]
MIVCLFEFEQLFQQLLHIFRLLGTPIEQQWPQNLSLAAPSLASDSSFS